jgi:hypothetical protein
LSTTQVVAVVITRYVEKVSLKPTQETVLPLREIQRPEERLGADAVMA